MKDVFLTPTHQALVNLAEICWVSATGEVLENCWHLAEKGSGDLDVILAALLFLDLSAEYRKNMLECLEYSSEKINAVEYVIDHQRFSKKIPHPTLELEILHDAFIMQELVNA